MKKIIAVLLLLSVVGMAFAGGFCRRHDRSYDGSQCPECRKEDKCNEATWNYIEANKKEKKAEDAFRSNRTEENRDKLYEARREERKQENKINRYCPKPQNDD